MKVQILVLRAVIAIVAVSALDNGLGKTPAMGWNSWNLYGCRISEKIVRSIVDGLVKTGLKDAGYEYVTIDDCWQIGRDAAGVIQVDVTRFPSGMKALSDYIHSKGLKFGIYSSAGTKTCEGRPGSLGFEQIDANTYAEWNVDLLKYDNCANKIRISEKQNRARYGAMRDALNATGRLIYYSMCNWGQAASWKWAADYSNSWRMSGDIGDLFNRFDVRCPCLGVECWVVGMNIGPNHCSVTNILDKMVQITGYSAPGGFSDMDMLEVGNGGMTTTEYRSHFSLWAVLKSPLILGNDVSNMTGDIKAILGNKEVIAINQDPLGKSAQLVERITAPSVFSTGFKSLSSLKLTQTPIVDVFTGPLSNQEFVAVLFNRDDEPHDIKLDFEKHLLFPRGTSAKLRDLWKHKDLGTFKNDFIAVQVEPHDVVVLRLSAVEYGKLTGQKKPEEKDSSRQEL